VPYKLPYKPIDKVRFQPWVGQDYTSRIPRPLVLGMSHYSWGDEDLPDYFVTNDVHSQAIPTVPSLSHSCHPHRSGFWHIACEIPLQAPLRRSLSPHSLKQKINFARDLQDRLGILALLALPAPFRICKLQIPLATRETDPVSGHHLASVNIPRQSRGLYFVSRSKRLVGSLTRPQFYGAT